MNQSNNQNKIMNLLLYRDVNINKNKQFESINDIQTTQSFYYDESNNYKFSVSGIKLEIIEKNITETLLKLNCIIKINKKNKIFQIKNYFNNEIINAKIQIFKDDNNFIIDYFNTKGSIINNCKFFYLFANKTQLVNLKKPFLINKKKSICICDSSNNSLYLLFIEMFKSNFYSEINNSLKFILNDMNCCLKTKKKYIKLIDLFFLKLKKIKHNELILNICSILCNLLTHFKLDEKYYNKYNELHISLLKNYPDELLQKNLNILYNNLVNKTHELNKHMN